VTSRTRFYGLLALLLVAIVIAANDAVKRIQQDLLTRAQAAVAAAEIPYYDLRIDGRDAVLGGFVTEGTDVARLVKVVARVPGVRTVRNEVTVEPLQGPDTERVAGTQSPELRAQRLGGVLIVTGRLPADGSADALEQVLRSHFPAAALRLDVRADRAVGPRSWTSTLGPMVAALGEIDEPSRLVAFGDVVQLSGQVSGPEQRTRLDTVLAGAPGLRWRLTLTRPSGGIGGAP